MINKLNLENVCRSFNFKGTFKSLDPYGDGHINDTYKVVYETDLEEEVNYILQRVNHEIFKETEKLMLNIENITSYLSDMIKEVELEGYEVLELIKTKMDRSYYKLQDGTFWRAYVFVENATGHTFSENNHMLYSAGKAFGEFQWMLKDFPVENLHETIIGFHNTPMRFNHLETSIKKDILNRKIDCEDTILFVYQRKAFTSIITEGIKNGDIPLRVTHNDTKLNNVLLDNDTLVGRCVIDLDTVMPGSALYDFGDAIRSCGSTVAEDEEDLSKLEFDKERFRAYTKGFLEILKNELTSREIELLPQAAILMTFECGMRFLTDYLNGDQYFKIHKKDHNLIRAKNQFKFVEKMEESLEEMISIVKSLC